MRSNDIVAVLAAIGSLLLVHEMEHMVAVAFNGSDAARVLALDDVHHSLGYIQLHLLFDLAILNHIDGNVGVEQAEECVVDVDFIIDFDDVLSSHFI